MKRNNESDLRILSIWIANASHTVPGAKNTLRKVVKKASEDAAFLYGPIKPKKNDDCEDPEGVREILAEFASYLDETFRNIEQDK